MQEDNQRAIAIIINNEGGRILPSETFFSAHINLLPQPVIPLIGIPCHRILVNEGRKTIPSRSIVLLGLRWMLRRLKFTNVAKQDEYALAKFLKKRKIKVVLAEYGPTAVSVMNACEKANVPLVAHFHGFDAYTTHVLSEYRKKYQDLFKIAKAIVAVSKDMKEQLVSIGAKDEKVFVNPCGADIPNGMFAEPKNSARKFVMVGRLVEKKAPFLSIMAFANIAKKYPDAQLDVIGDGVLLNSCQQIAQSLNIKNQVAFHGAQPHAVVFDLMKQARCFIQHSVITPNNDHEGTPVGLLEAMGMGLPVVATRHGGISDVIKDGITGNLVDEYDVNAMTSAMLQYAEDSEYAQKIGENARADILQNRTSKISVDRLNEIIESATHN